MKILFVDDMLWGHHIPYLKALADSHFYESVVLIPEKVPGLAAEQIVCEKLSFDTKKISDYMECINFIENQAQKKKADKKRRNNKTKKRMATLGSKKNHSL